MLEKNDEVELEITDMADGGEGIGRAGGMVFFVKDAVIGDRARARVTKVKKSYAYARLLEVLEPSPLRGEPFCPLHRRCGGCQLQALRYEAQLSFKQNKIRNDLVRIGGIPQERVDAVLQPIAGADSLVRYRNKAQFPIGTGRDGSPVAGFYAARSHDIVPVGDCALGIPENAEVISRVLSYMRENGVPAYDEKTGGGLLRHVLIRHAAATGELLCCLIINGRSLPNKGRLISSLREVEGMTSISINTNTGRNNVILGPETKTIWGLPYITDEIAPRVPGEGGGFSREAGEDESFCESAGGESACGLQGREAFGEADGGGAPGSARGSLRFHISPQSFYQVNTRQMEKLYGIVISYTRLTGRETVLDLYCGIGTITLLLARRARMVCGIESVRRAVEDARENAALNGISNAKFYCGRAEDLLAGCADADEDAGSSCRADAAEGEAAWTPGSGIPRPDVIVADPPRKGCDTRCIEAMIAMRPDRIVYVSCDPATLSRDIRALREGGYELERARGVDQFAQTVHVEAVALMSRVGD